MRSTRLLPALTALMLIIFVDFFKAGTAHYRTKRLANATMATERIDFMVSLESKPYWFFMPYEHVCGGTVISSNWVLSSAHCFFGQRSIDMIGHGSNDQMKLRHIEIQFVVVPVDFKKKFQPECNCAFDSDIALIKTKKTIPVHSLDNIPTLNRYAIKPFKKVKLFSWGQIEDGTYAVRLREATFKIVSNLVAFTRNTRNIYSYANQIALPGDSGSPLTSMDRKKLYGVHVGKMGDLSVSVSTEYYANWILYVMYEYKELFKGRRERIIRCCKEMNETVYHMRRISRT